MTKNTYVYKHISVKIFTLKYKTSSLRRQMDSLKIFQVMGVIVFDVIHSMSFLSEV